MGGSVPRGGNGSSGRLHPSTQKVVAGSNTNLNATQGIGSPLLRSSLPTPRAVRATLTRVINVSPSLSPPPFPLPRSAISSSRLSKGGATKATTNITASTTSAATVRSVNLFNGVHGEQPEQAAVPDVPNAAYYPGQDGERRPGMAAASYTSTAQQHGISNAAYTPLPHDEQLQTMASIYDVHITPPKKSTKPKKGRKEYNGYYADDGSRWVYNICKKTISAKGSSAPAHINKRHIFLSLLYASYHICIIPFAKPKKGRKEYDGYCTNDGSRWLLRYTGTSKLLYEECGKPGHGDGEGHGTSYYKARNHYLWIKWPLC
ncbi:hypothetical protein DL769_005458 [Monosporascus sp. CRB-8-3]|nr:hypothetical protein DL769_005458 [Monosporascus sp. CRB-8-3]